MAPQRTVLECAILTIEVAARITLGVISLVLATAVMTGLFWFMGVAF